MSDLISRPAAIEKLNERAREMFSFLPGFEYYLGALHDAAADLRNMQTIDAVPVVRCKDCKYYNPPFEVDGKRFEGDCDFHEWYRAAPEEYDFCSKGVKKTDV